MKDAKLVSSANEIDVSNETMIGLDIETTSTGEYRHGKMSTDPRLNKLLMVQISTSQNNYYLLDNFKSVKALLSKRPDIAKLTHTGTFEYRHMMHHLGVEIDKIIDVAVCERILDNGRNKKASLAVLSDKYLGMRLDKSVRDEIIAGSSVNDRIIDYGTTDAYVLKPIYDKQQELLYEGARRVEKVEYALLPVVAKMELRGMKLDIRAWLNIAKANQALWDTKKAELAKYDKSKVRRITMWGESLTDTNTNSNQWKAEILRDRGIEVASTKATVLAEYNLRHPDPFVQLLLDYSSLQKSVSTYGVDFIKQYVNPVTRRVHQSIKQVEARTGRMSGTGPNLMNIPKASRFRDCFIAPPHRLLVAADFSQQELRILAELSGDRNLTRAFESGLDVHVFVARILFHDQSITEADVDRRRKAKNINFGLIYGMGEKKLSLSLKVSQSEGRELLREHARNFPDAIAFLDEQVKRAKTNGWVETMLHRRRYVDTELFSYERIAKNTPIQGTGADITKLALIVADKELTKKFTDAFLVNVVHDEIVVECNKEDALDVLKCLTDSMVKGAEVLVKKVPFAADGYISERWSKKK